MKRMIKKDVIQAMKVATGHDEEVCRQMIDAFTKAIVDGCGGSGQVKLNGFGTFTRRERPPRVARDPRNGREIHVPAKRILHFSPTPGIFERGN